MSDLSVGIHISNSNDLHIVASHLERVGFLVEADPSGNCWVWSYQGAGRHSVSDHHGALEGAWSSAARHVRDVLFASIDDDEWVKHWGTMSLRQQARLIQMCFEDLTDEVSQARCLLQVITENDMLQDLLHQFGQSVESRDYPLAIATWLQVKALPAVSVLE